MRVPQKVLAKAAKRQIQIVKGLKFTLNLVFWPEGPFYRENHSPPKPRTVKSLHLWQRVHMQQLLH